MRKVLALFLSWFVAMPSLLGAPQPPYTVKDQATEQNFRQIFLDVDPLTQLITRTGSNDSIGCIGNPAFCVDTTNYRIGIDTATPAYPIDVYVSGSQIFYIDDSGEVNGFGRLNVLSNSTNGNTQLTVKNDSSGTTANAGLFANNGTSNTGLYQYGTGATATLLGFTLANWGVLKLSASGKGLILDTVDSVPIVFGTHDTKMFEIDTSSLTALYPLAMKATSTNDSAKAGDVGEFAYSFIDRSSGVDATGSTNMFDVTSIDLDPGEWIIDAMIGNNLNSATASGAFAMGISATSGNSTSGLNLGDNFRNTTTPTASADGFGTIPGYHVQLSANTTYYLKAKATYSAGTPQCYGRIFAWRPR